MIKISLTGIYNFLKKYYPWILIGFFVLVICLSAAIYYQYVYLIMKAEPNPAAKKTLVNEQALNQFLDNLNRREENLNRVKNTDYSNPFAE